MPYSKKTDRVTKPEGKAAVLSSEDMSRLFAELSPRDRALFGVCRYTCSRISEVCQLRIDDVFGADGKVKTRIVFRKGTTKGGYGGKSVAVSEELRQILEAYLVPEKGDYLFPGRHGRGHINPISASALLKEVCDRLGLEHVSTHSFRRTSINNLRKAGFQLEEIQRVSGHKSLEGLSHYLEVDEGRLVEAVGCL